jgi:hypothetical protein
VQTIGVGEPVTSVPASQAVRVSPVAYGALKELAAESGKPIVRYLDDLVQEAYQRRVWARFAEANRGIEENATARTARQDEDAIWSVADLDGLDSDEGIDWNEGLEDAATW